MSILLIRKATRDDAKAILDIRIAAIYAQCRAFYKAETIESWTSGSLTEQFAGWVESSFHVAVEGDRVLGSGAVDLDSGQIDAVFVRPEAMHKGIGSRLLARLEEIAVAAGLAQLVLHSTLNAVPFYRKCGYAGDGIAVYSSPRGFELDCVPMSKVLRPT